MIPKLDLSKVKPYDKPTTQSVQSVKYNQNAAMKHSTSPSLIATGYSTINNATITSSTFVANSIMDDSEFMKRKSTGYSGSSSAAENRKKSNPSVPPLDLSRVSQGEVVKKKLPLFDNKSIDSWQVKIERFPKKESENWQKI